MNKYQKDYEYSQMSLAAYGNSRDSAPDGWKLVAHHDLGNDEFVAYVFKKDNQIAIAFRGTDSNEDIRTDLGIAVPIPAWSVQFEQGLEYAESFKRNNPHAEITVTGHSLGGALAQVVSQSMGLKGVTFDPGAAGNLVESSQFQAWNKQHGLPANGMGVPKEFNNYVVNKSAVSNGSGEHVGQETALSGSAGRTFAGSMLGIARIAGPMVSSPLEPLEQLQRHSMERINRVFEYAAKTGELFQQGSIPIDPLHEHVLGNQRLSAEQKMHYRECAEYFECGISPLTNGAQTHLREQYVNDYLQQHNLQSVQEPTKPVAEPSEKTMEGAKLDNLNTSQVLAATGGISQGESAKANVPNLAEQFRGHIAELKENAQVAEHSGQSSHPQLSSIEANFNRVYQEQQQNSQPLQAMNQQDQSFINHLKVGLWQLGQVDETLGKTDPKYQAIHDHLHQQFPEFAKLSQPEQDQVLRSWVGEKNEQTLAHVTEQTQVLKAAFNSQENEASKAVASEVSQDTGARVIERS